MRKEILQAERANKKARKNLHETLKRIQKTCLHKKVHEAPYKEDPWFHCHQPPFRVCIDCGYAEEGWGCGFQLTAKSKVVTQGSRDDVNKLRRGPLRTNSAAWNYKMKRLTEDEFFVWW